MFHRYIKLVMPNLNFCVCLFFPHHSKKEHCEPLLVLPTSVNIPVSANGTCQQPGHHSTPILISVPFLLVLLPKYHYVSCHPYIETEILDKTLVPPDLLLAIPMYCPLCCNWMIFKMQNHIKPSLLDIP